MANSMGSGSIDSSPRNTSETTRFFIYSFSFSVFLFHSRIVNSYFRDWK
jgi:hypothetical protein